MKTLSHSIKTIYFLLIACFMLISCNVDDEAPIKEPPTNELTSYTLPQEVQDLFTPSVMEITGSLEPFLDRIISKGMKIYTGSDYPNIYRYKRDENLYLSGDIEPLRLRVKHDCIYDEKYPSFADTLFGEYHESIFFHVEEPELNRISYSSVEGLDPSKLPEGLDSGSSQATIIGDKNNFTLFFKVENGMFNKIRYSAIWIYSGTFNSNVDFKANVDSSFFSNVSKCMILLSKGNDPNNQMANIGTIRIYQDTKTEIE